MPNLRPLFNNIFLTFPTFSARIKPEPNHVFGGMIYVQSKQDIEQ